MKQTQIDKSQDKEAKDIGKLIGTVLLGALDQLISDVRRRKGLPSAEGDYEPFGPEWKAEVMKNKKEHIVDMLLKPALQGRLNLAEQVQEERQQMSKIKEQLKIYIINLRSAASFKSDLTVPLNLVKKQLKYLEELKLEE